MNFQQLDLNLLRVLVAIHRTGSVTAASKTLHITQSATSNALNRLRTFFQDDLFVRSPNGLQRTRLCEQLAPVAVTHLQTLESFIGGLERFDPLVSETTWRMSLSDLGEMLFLPPLASLLRQLAPRTRISNIAVAATAVATALETREIDCVIGLLRPRHSGIHADILVREQYVAVTAHDWEPEGGSTGPYLTRDQLNKASIVVASPTATFYTGVEDLLGKLDLANRIVLRTRHFGALSDLLERSDLLAIVPSMYADIRPGLKKWKLPFDAADDLRLIWHESTASDPAQQWLRARLFDLYRTADPQASDN